MAPSFTRAFSGSPPTFVLAFRKVRHLRLLLPIKLGILAAIAVSSALLVDQLAAAPAYCDAASGCTLARRAASEWLGAVPLPLLGCVALTIQLLLTLVTHDARGRRLLFGVSLLGAVAALALLAIQAFVLHAFCPWCVVVDLLSLGVFGLVVRFCYGPQTQVTGGARLGLSFTLAHAALAVTLPFVWPQFRPASPPPAVLLPYFEPHTTNLVEFVDLECPHCRALYPTLEALQKQYGASLTWKRVHVPLRGHVVAREAARLLYCLGESPLGTALEAELFAASNLSQESFVQTSLKLGVTQEVMARCAVDPAAQAQLLRDAELLSSLGSQGLPLTFVQGERIVGNQSPMTYRDAIARVRRPAQTSRLQTFGFLAIVVMLTGALQVVTNASLRPRNSGGA